jgi:calcium-dependent protein kinase
VAIKAIVYSDLNNHKQFINECNIMIKLDHPNIVNIIEIWEWDKLLFLVMDFYEGGELFDYLKSREYFEEFEVFKVIKQMASILVYMEENQIQHKDLKLENFLLKDKEDLSNIKVVDFGLSKDLSHSNVIQNASGTPFYVAPETLMLKGSIKSDIWSLGVIMYIMLSGKVPFTGQSSDQILKNVLNQEVDFSHPSFIHVSQEAKDLILRMLDRNIDTRISS